MRKDRNNRGGGKSLTDKQNERVRTLIAERLSRWTQLALAEQLRMDQSSLSKFMSGKQGTTFQTVYLVAGLLGEDPLELLGIVPETERDVLPERAKARKAARLLGYETGDVDAGLAAEMSQDNARRSARDWLARIDRARSKRLGEIEPRVGADNPTEDALPPPPPAGRRGKRL